MSNILEEVKKLLGKGAIELVPPGQEGQGFYSTFFIVPKKDGGLRPILNLKPLNVYMEKSHFKMETLRSIIQALHVGEWGSTIDLRDAYLQIPMFPPHRKYLRFCVQGVHYQFRAMPFGITVAPRVFTKLMAAVGGHLRSQQIHIFMYLDDWLVKNPIRELLLHQLNQTIQLLVDLGLIINLDKCHLVPSQIITYLGAVFNLNKGLVLPSENRFLAINQAIADIIYIRQCPASLFLRLLGLMASCIDTVPYGRLHMRPIQIYLLYFWRPHIDGLQFKIPVFPILATHLIWWQQERNIFRGVPLQGYPHNKVLWTDASKWGWGAHLGTCQVAGQWPKEFINHHINWLEMRAVWNALIESGGDSGRESAYQMRQCHSSGIYKQARGNQIDTALSSFMGHDAMVFKTQHSHPCSSYSREEELSGRQVVPGSETCAFDRMGTQTINSSTYFSNNGNPKHRSLCHSCQLSASSVLQSLSRSPSMDMRCTVCELGGDIRICISSPHTHSQSINESQTRELLNSSSSTFSSTSVLVSSASRVNSGCSSKTTRITRPVVSEQRSVITSKSQLSKSGSVENICRSKSSKQFSSKASKYMEQSIRSSTRRLYSVRWEIFSSWCAERQISPTSASVGNVADFLVYLHSVKKCKVATIIGYRSAISS
ncbi:MAG: reverse transcriptase domain-containing protein, partial [Gammaproteobacteria bacterium]|nr:reverse transcriptase domain-containing protein [Gammaproteobacteria bacterium]